MKKLALVDIGVNLDHRSYDKDRGEVITRAVASGVSEMVLTGTNMRSSRAVLELARKYPGVLYCTAGIHPHNAREGDPRTILTLRELAANPEVVAIGECGLDYNRDFSPRPQQDKMFAAQIELACELKMPLFLHERDAHQRFKEILGGFGASMPPAVAHCFTGSREELENYLEMGLFIGITGWICDERRGRHLRDLVNLIPLDRLMLETDAPFLTPRDMVPKPRDGRNEPAFLPHILHTVADCLGLPPAEVAEATTRNARAFFGLENR